MKTLIFLKEGNVRQEIAKVLCEKQSLQNVRVSNNLREIYRYLKAKEVNLFVTDTLLEGEPGLLRLLKKFKLDNQELKIVSLHTMEDLQANPTTGAVVVELADLVVLKEMGLDWFYVRLDKLIEQLTGANLLPEKLVVHSDGVTFFINPEEIIFIEKVEKSLLFHLPGRSLRSYGNLNQLVTKLPRYFFRSHRAYLINIAKIKTIRQQGRSFLVEFAQTKKKAILSYERQKFLMRLFVQYEKC